MLRLADLGVSAFVIVGFGVAAMAADDPLAGAYGNTLVMTHKGETTTMWVKPDGTYTGLSPKGQKFSGKWRLGENGKFCATADLPLGVPAGTPAPKESCFAFEGGHQAGDTWEQPEPDGGRKIIEIKAGV